MSRTFAAVVASLCVGLAGLGCGSSEPSEPVLEGEFYPMAVGNSWEYEETDVQTQSVETIRYDVQSMTTMSFDHLDGEREAFVVENTWPNNPDRALEHRTQFVQDDGTRAVRLAHMVYDTTGTLTKDREFAPNGFLRFDRSRLTEGAKWTEQIDRYTDTHDGTAEQWRLVTYDYEVQSLYEQVTVPAGTFDCVVIRRQFLDEELEVKIYYWAPNVGKVKEITEGDKTEELVSHQVTTQ